MDQHIPAKQIFMFMQIEAIAVNDNSDDGKPWIRSVDAVNINLTQQPSSYTQTTLTGVPASQPESSSQVPPLACPHMHAFNPIYSHNLTNCQRKLLACSCEVTKAECAMMCHVITLLCICDGRFEQMLL